MLSLVFRGLSNDPYLPEKHANDGGEIDDRSKDEDWDPSAQGFHDWSEPDRADRVEDSVANQDKADL